MKKGRFPFFLPKVAVLLTRRRQQAWWLRSRSCAFCGQAVRLTLDGPVTKRRMRRLGIRCAECLVVLCLPCAHDHFGLKRGRGAGIENTRQRNARRGRIQERRRVCGGLGAAKKGRCYGV